MRTIWRLLRLLRPFWGEVLLSILLGAATIASGIGLMGTSAWLIASAALRPGIETLQVAIVGVRFFGISRGVFRYLERLVSHSVNFRLLSRLRVWYYRALEPLAPGGLQGLQGGDLLNRAIGDIEVLENFYVRLVAPPVVAALIAAGVSLFAGAYALPFALILAGGLTLNGLVLPALFYLIGRTPGARAAQARSTLTAAFIDAVQGVADRLSWNGDAAVLARVRDARDGYEAAQEQIAAESAAGSVAGLLLNHLTVWLILLAGVPLAHSGGLDGVALAVLALIGLSSFEAVQPLPQAAQLLGTALASARRLFELADAEPLIAAPAAARDVTGAFHIEARRLTFAYPGSAAPALEGFDLDLSPGRRVALIGPNGAGKSTFVDLLLRLWDVPAGTIRVDGVDIRACSPEQLRAHIAVVPQRSFLFSGTLAENVLLAAPGRAQGDLNALIEAVGLQALVARLPGGLDAWVGAQGDQLSGGERQRVAAARALARASRLLILDEPAANLDAASARALVDALFVAYAGRAILWITHQVLGLEKMDEIVVLREGKVIERGTHAELLQRGGWYAQALALQRSVF